MEMADPKADDDLDKLMEEMGRLQEKIDACDGWELDRMMDIASDALVLPPDDTPVRQLSGGERRRVALCMALAWKSRICCSWTSPRTTSTPRPCSGSNRRLREYPGTVIIVTHDRYFLDNITKLDSGAGKRPRAAIRGQLLLVAAAEGRTAPRDGKARVAAAKDACSASWTGSATRTKAAGRRTRPASSPTSSSPPQQLGRRQERGHHPDRHRAAAGRQGAHLPRRLQGLYGRRRTAHAAWRTAPSTCPAAASSA